MIQETGTDVPTAGGVIWRLIWWVLAAVIPLVYMLVYAYRRGATGGDDGFSIGVFTTRHGRRHGLSSFFDLLAGNHRGSAHTDTASLQPITRPTAGPHAQPSAPPRPFHVPRRVYELMRYYQGSWGIAGGWAIDLHLGRETRSHDDVEVAVLYREQEQLREHLIGWQAHYVHKPSGELLLWRRGETLSPPVHEIHTAPPQSDVPRLELLLNEAGGEDWVYRRDPRVCLPLARAILVDSQYTIPYLAPEIVLLYKSVNTRARDENDFNAALDYLSFEQQVWLRDALRLTAPGHLWLEELG